MTDNSDWYFLENNKIIGPISKDRLRTLAQTGRILSNTAVRRGEEGKWIAARQIESLVFSESPTRLTKRRSANRQRSKDVEETDETERVKDMGMASCSLSCGLFILVVAAGGVLASLVIAGILIFLTEVLEVDPFLAIGTAVFLLLFGAPVVGYWVLVRNQKTRPVKAESPSTSAESKPNKETIHCAACGNALSVHRDRSGVAELSSVMAVLGVKKVRLLCKACNAVMDVDLAVGVQYE